MEMDKIIIYLVYHQDLQWSSLHLILLFLFLPVGLTWTKLIKFRDKLFLSSFFKMMRMVSFLSNLQGFINFIGMQLLIFGGKIPKNICPLLYVGGIWPAMSAALSEFMLFFNTGDSSIFPLNSIQRDIQQLNPSHIHALFANHQQHSNTFSGIQLSNIQRFRWSLGFNYFVHHYTFNQSQKS